MKAWNRESRELKLRYDEQRASINLEYNTRQVQLTHDMDMARNSLHYANQALRSGEDVCANKRVLDDVVGKLRDLGLEKVKLDYERKNALVALDRQRNADIDALEAKYGVNLDEEGGLS